MKFLPYSQYLTMIFVVKHIFQENGKQLTVSLLRKAKLLPFAKNYTLVPVLFLKNAPANDAGNAILPADVLELAK